MSSIEDIDYLKKNSIKQSYTILIDSGDRDRNIYPEPQEYVINFEQPFRNVIGIEVIDASIPRTMYSIDMYNCTLVYYIGSDNDDIIINGFNSSNYNINKFKTFTMPLGDYSLQTFIPTFNNIMTDLQIESVSNPPELTNLITFTCSNPFILNMYESTMSETLGFDTYIKKNNNDYYTYIQKYNNNKIFSKLYHSIHNIKRNNYTVTSPGMVYFIGDKYVILRCPEIEDHLYSSLSYSKHNLGIAKFRVNSLGYNDGALIITKMPVREFHPIGKLNNIHLIFQTNNGMPYDFKGINHNIVFAIYYYEPTISKIENFNSILNPNYKPNYNDYLYTTEEQDDDDDEEKDEEDFSRDNIDYYKHKELLFNQVSLP